MCNAAHGWMAPEDVIAATEGWAIEPDANWAAAMRADLERKRASIERTLKRIAHAPPNHILMGRWQRSAVFFSLEARNRRREKRLHRKAAKFFDGEQWPVSLRTKAEGCNPLIVNRIRLG